MAGLDAGRQALLGDGLDRRGVDGRDRACGGRAQLERLASRPTISSGSSLQTRVAEDGRLGEDRHVATTEVGVGQRVVERAGHALPQGRDRRVDVLLGDPRELGALAAARGIGVGDLRNSGSSPRGTAW